MSGTGQFFDFTDPENQPYEQLINTLMGVQCTLPDKSPTLNALRQRFRSLTGIEIRQGGRTLGTEEGRMVCIAMKELLGYVNEIKCVDHGWNKRWGKGDTWGSWMPIYFERQIEGEYQSAISGIEAIKNANG